MAFQFSYRFIGDNLADPAKTKPPRATYEEAQKDWEEIKVDHESKLVYTKILEVDKDPVARDPRSFVVYLENNRPLIFEDDPRAAAVQFLHWAEHYHGFYVEMSTDELTERLSKGEAAKTRDKDGRFLYAGIATKR